MGSKVRRADAGLGVVVGLIAFSCTLVIVALMTSTGTAFAAASIAGLALGVVTAAATSGSQDPLIRASLERQADVLRELVRTTVPAAAELATDRDGRMDPSRFQELVIASIAAASDPRLELGATGPAVWDYDGRGARTPDQERRLQRLLTYPNSSEAPELLAALAGLGPQTIVQFAALAVRTRSRIAVGLEGVTPGPATAVLSGHLVAAGLVQQVDEGASAVIDPGPDGAYYALTPAGTEVARLFAPLTIRPQELAALDPAPSR